MQMQCACCMSPGTQPRPTRHTLHTCVRAAKFGALAYQILLQPPKVNSHLSPMVDSHLLPSPPSGRGECDELRERHVGRDAGRAAMAADPVTQLDEAERVDAELLERAVGIVLGRVAAEDAGELEA